MVRYSRRVKHETHPLGPRLRRLRARARRHGTQARGRSAPRARAKRFRGHGEQRTKFSGFTESPRTNDLSQPGPRKSERDGRAEAFTRRRSPDRCRFHPAAGTAVRDAAHKRQETGTTIWKYDIVRPDGTSVGFRRAFPSRTDGEGMCIACGGWAEDITARRQMREDQFRPRKDGGHRPSRRRHCARLQTNLYVSPFIQKAVFVPAGGRPKGEQDTRSGIREIHGVPRSGPPISRAAPDIQPREGNKHGIEHELVIGPP